MTQAEHPMPAESRVLRIGEWRVDPGLDELSREGQTIRLEPRPMRLLLYLAAHAGRVVDVQELLDEVWPNVVVTQGSVYQAVAELRRILGHYREHPSYIENLPRRGYRLVAPVAPWNAAHRAAASDETQAATGSSQATNGPIPAELQTVSAGRDQAVKTRNEAVAALPPVPVGRSRRSAVLGGITLVAVIVAGIALGAFWSVRHMQVTGGRVDGKTEVLVTPALTTFAAPRHSIAVLPFVDMSEKHDQEYFSDGLSEELIALLTKVPDLSVPARTSSFFFKGKSDDIATIAQKLRVEHVLEGSVRKEGNTIRVTAQLVRADNGYHLWSETYDRELKDLFKVQDDIANEVVQALKVKLAVTPTAERAPTDSIAAHNFLLEGRFFADRWAPGDSERAISSLEHALKEDPNYALAWAELSWAEMWSWAQRGRTAGFYESATHAALRAIELRPDLAQAHATRGWCESLLGFDWAVADMEFNKALAIDPRNLRALYGKGRLARVLRKTDESLHYYQVVLERDPVSAFSMQGLVATYLAARKPADAVRASRKASELGPSMQWGHWYLGYALLWNGELEAALREMRLEPTKSLSLSGIALVEQARRNPRAADAALRDLLAIEEPPKPYFVAAVYAARGDSKSAIAWLERARVARVGFFGEVTADPAFNAIRRDSAFVAYIRRMKLPG